MSSSNLEFKVGEYLVPTLFACKQLPNFYTKGKKYLIVHVDVTHIQNYYTIDNDSVKNIKPHISWFYTKKELEKLEFDKDYYNKIKELL